ncbi:hypothetical protein ABKN59_009633 [Abortiporus biennis]
MLSLSHSDTGGHSKITIVLFLHYASEDDVIWNPRTSRRCCVRDIMHHASAMSRNDDGYSFRSMIQPGQ